MRKKIPLPASAIRSKFLADSAVLIECVLPLRSFFLPFSSDIPAHCFKYLLSRVFLILPSPALRYFNALVYVVSFVSLPSWSSILKEPHWRSRLYRPGLGALPLLCEQPQKSLTFFFSLVSLLPEKILPSRLLFPARLHPVGVRMLAVHGPAGARRRHPLLHATAA